MRRTKPPRFHTRRIPSFGRDLRRKSEAALKDDSEMYSHPHDSSWSLAYRDVRREPILTNEFHVNIKHGLRHMLVGMTMVLAPMLIVASSLALMVLRK